MARGQDGLHVEMMGGGTPPRSAHERGYRELAGVGDRVLGKEEEARVCTVGSVTHEGV